MLAVTKHLKVLTNFANGLMLLNQIITGHLSALHEKILLQAVSHHDYRRPSRDSEMVIVLPF